MINPAINTITETHTAICVNQPQQIIHWSIDFSSEERVSFFTGKDVSWVKGAIKFGFSFIKFK